MSLSKLTSSLENVPVQFKTPKSKGYNTTALFVEDLAAFVVSTNSDKKFPSHSHLAYIVKTSFTEEDKTSLLLLCRISYLRIAKKKKGIKFNELSIEALNHNRESFKHELFGLSVQTSEIPLDATSDQYKNVLELYLAAVYLVRSPIMLVLNFITEVLPAVEESWGVLKIYVGLCSINEWNESSRSSLPQVLNCVFMTQLPVNQPIILLPQFLHILECLKESNDNNLYSMLLHEFLSSRTAVFYLSNLEDWGDIIALFIAKSLPPNEYWTIYVSGGTRYAPVSNLRKLVVSNDSDVIVRDLADLSASASADSIMILTTRKKDYLHDTVVPLLRTIPHQGRSSSTWSTLLSPTAPSFPQESSAPYGFMTQSQYQGKKKLLSSAHFNIVKDVLAPHLNKFSIHLVQAQYRKNDHLWFSFSRHMRHDWYETVRTTPTIPLHWVKVPQPDGFDELESRVKKQARVQLDSSSHETAELVLLNSQPIELVEIKTQSSHDPIIISLQEVEEAHDQGFIGCDFLMEQYEVHGIAWTECRPFDIKRDQRIGRLLPLPSKKDLGDSSTLSSIPEGQPSAQPSAQPAALQGQPLSHTTPRSRRPEAVTPAPSLGSFYPRQTRPYLEATAEIEEAMLVSEHQIKKEAMNGFDRPGYCFYGDQVLFQMTKEYPLPDSLSTCRVLREGGNGVVLEVKYSGEVYAVKRTAFRWREVLIMPKLRHKNILKLVAMMIGKPLEGHSKRRYVYQLYPKLSNDLGRSVGSFEKHCLRTLEERYMGEPLLLRKVKSNFRYVAHEILVALEYLHSRPSPIVHRDVKASNILVKMLCDCPNPLICVCRRRPDIILSDFDASLELHKDGTLEPDPPRSSAFGFQTSTSKVYHVSAVGTVGYKSPEGSMYCIGNHLDVMPPLSTKADIFGFGVLMSLLFLNEEGPKHQEQMAKLLLLVNQTVAPGKRLSMEQRAILKKNGVSHFRPVEIAVSKKDVDRVLPLGRAKRDLGETREIISFLEQSLNPDPLVRPTAMDLLRHPYLREHNS